MNTPLISLVVPIYKVEPFLRKCVDSILAQSYADIEVILVDDGSPDNCPAICDEYAARDKRVVVIHQSNAGVSAARNAGLETAKGEYISFVDGDDWIEPDFLEVLYELKCSSKADIAAVYSCIGDFKPAKTNPKDYVVFSPRETLAKLLNNQYEFIAIWGKLFTREVIKNIRFFPQFTIAEDTVFNTQAIVNSRKICYINYQGYHYTLRADSASHDLKKNSISFLDAVNMIMDILKDFDGSLAKYAENHIIHLDLYLAKRLEKSGLLSREAYKRILAHIRKYDSLEARKLLDFRKKCNLFLLWSGRIPFIAGRRIAKSLRKLKRR